MTTPRKDPQEQVVSKYVNTSLEDYLKAAASESQAGTGNQTEILNRPFDKKAGIMGPNAQAIKPEDFNLEDLSLDYVIGVCRQIDHVLQDLQPHQNILPKDDAHARALKDGYVFNAYNRNLDAEKQRDNKSDPAYQGMRINRSFIFKAIVKAYVSEGKTPEQIFKEQWQANQEKVNGIYESCLRDYLFANKEPRDVLRDNQVRELRLGGMDMDTFTRNVEMGAVICERMLQDNFPVTAKLEETKKYVEHNKSTLARAWGRCMAEIEQDYRKDLIGDPNLKIMKTLYFQGHDKTEEFKELAKFANDVFSIQKRYENKWLGLKRMFFQNEPKMKAIHDISDKMSNLISQYPAKNVEAIKSEMMVYLKERAKQIEGNTVIKDQIKRLDVMLEQEAKQTKSPEQTKAKVIEQYYTRRM